MSSFLITGASRGFGFALARELASRPASEVGTVIAACRDITNSTELQALKDASSGRVMVVKLDVTNQASINDAKAQVEAKLKGQGGLDVLFNNAGICQYAQNGTKSMENLEESFNVNVMGVHKVTQAFLPLLQEGKLKKVANISTTFGSINFAPHVHFMPAPAYKISKAALNALTVQYALDHANEGFSFMALCPGWLKTELGGGDMADLTPEQGAKASLDILYRPNQETNGKMPKVFVKGFDKVQGINVYDGTDAPW